MSRRRYVWHRGDWLDVTDWRPAPRKAPYIVRDCMDALRHPATGELMDSKSEFRRVTKAHGMVEVGNDAPAATRPAYDPRDIAADVAQAWDMLVQGYQPPPAETADADTRILN